MAVFDGTNGADTFYLVDTDADDVFHGFDGVDRIVAGLGNDQLYGGIDNDILSGGPGADIIDGGNEKYDFLQFVGATAGVNVDLVAGVGHGGDAEGDVYRGIEIVSATDYNDRVIGNQFNVADSLQGLNGDDSLYGNDGNDSLLGGDGNDRLVGGSGADVLAGGAGIDWVYYHTAASGVVVTLGINAGTDGDAEGDTYDSIENAYGSIHNDILRGSAATNVLVGNTGADTLSGGVANDYFLYQAVSDSTVATSGRDYITDFSHAQGDKIDLRPIDADGNGANGNTAFTFTDGGAFTGSGHEVIVLPAGGGVYTVLADIDGDKVADMAINVHSATELVAGDFML